MIHAHLYLWWAHDIIWSYTGLSRVTVLSPSQTSSHNSNVNPSVHVHRAGDIEMVAMSSYLDHKISYHIN